MSINKRKKPDHNVAKSDFQIKFAEVLKTNPPPIPPALLKNPFNRTFGHNTGTIKVIVRLKYLEYSKAEGSHNGSPSQSFITVDGSKKQIIVTEPPSATLTPRRGNTSIPKIFAFDAVYTDDDDMTELCSNSLTDIIQAVVNGIDGCIFSFGHLRGVSSVMIIGSDQHIRKWGIIPCAISWLFRLISEQKEKTGARFSVRVSALEVFGKHETLKDLLAEVEIMDSASQYVPDVYLRDDPVWGTQLQNQIELRAPTADKAAFYLDAALAARTICATEEDNRLSHLLFTLHVYQYRVERGTTGSAVAGGRSRLHLLDFASGRTLHQPNDLNNKEPSKTETECTQQETQSISTALSLSALAAVLLALVNGQRHIPNRTSKLSQLLREAMSSLSCRVCMIAHVATNNTLFDDNMQIIQFASKMQRLKRRKLSKLSGTSSEDSSSCDSFGLRRASRFRKGNINFPPGSGNNPITASEADYTSSSDQSCDTVIFLGATRYERDNDHSLLILRKRRISIPHSVNVITKKSGSESDLTKLETSRHGTKPLLKTNTAAWPKVAAKNAIETLSTQKEMWVDGPKAIFENISGENINSHRAKFINRETQTYLLEECPHSNATVAEFSQDISSQCQKISNPSTTTISNPLSESSTTIVSSFVNTSLTMPSCNKAQLLNCLSTISNPLETDSHAYKSSVRDWVEKHSDMLFCSPFVNESGSQPFILSSRKNSQSPQKKPVKHCSKHQQLMSIKTIQETENIDKTINVCEREGRKRLKSDKHRPIHISATTDHNYIISVEPTITRVEEWVRSISEDTSRTQSLSPVRQITDKTSNNTMKYPIKNPQDVCVAADINYHSLDRHYQHNIPMELPPQQTSKTVTSVMQNSWKSVDSTPLSILHFHQKEIINSKFRKQCSQISPKIPNQEAAVLLNRVKTTISQNPEVKSYVTVDKHNNQSSMKHNSGNKCRSSSLIKDAFFRRSKQSSNTKNDESNIYSLPNSPFKTLTCSRDRDLNPVANTGGYQYVVMTSSFNTTVAPILETGATLGTKTRSFSTSPGKTSGLFNDKKSNATQSSARREKNNGKKREFKGTLSFLKNPLFGKKKDKNKKPIPKIMTVTKISLTSVGHEMPSKVPSPYCTVTQPKQSAQSSSGHGSDCSSIYVTHHKYGDLPSQSKCIDEETPCLAHKDAHSIDPHGVLRHSQRRVGGHTSSGYESILRDSEVSSQNDSTSESSLGVIPRAQTPDKQQSQSSSSSSKQSHSAPNRSEETSEDTQSPVSVRKMSPNTVQKFQIKNQQHREIEIKKIAKQIEMEKIYDLLAQQDILKTELKQAKERILVDSSSWSNDLHVVEQMDPEDSSFYEALEKETDILRRRVEACKSHVMLITYFDCKYLPRILSGTNDPGPFQVDQRKFL